MLSGPSRQWHSGVTLSGKAAEWDRSEGSQLESYALGLASGTNLVMGLPVAFRSNKIKRSDKHRVKQTASTSVTKIGLKAAK